MNEDRICEITSTECLYERCDKCPIENHEIQLVPLDKILDKVLEIIDRNVELCESKYHLGDFMPDVYALLVVRKEFEALKGGEQE